MLTAATVAQQLGLSVRAVYALAGAGRLVCYRFGRAVRFDAADVEALRLQCRSTATRPAPAGGTSFRASLTDADAALQSYFRQRGHAPKPKPTPASATPSSTQLRLVP